MDPMFLIVLIGAVSFTLVALYQWAGKGDLNKKAPSKRGQCNNARLRARRVGALMRSAPCLICALG
jgi:hypothetical protein